MVSVREVAGLARSEAFARLPVPVRGWAQAHLPEGWLPAPWRGHSYFEASYEHDEDPFGFDREPEEGRKFQATLDLCGAGPFERGLEIGCAIGSFTEMLAPRCRSLLAIDVAESAVERTRHRLGQTPTVRVERIDLEESYPDGRFDLVVASDVLYYLSAERLGEVLTAIESSLEPDGALVIAHFAPPMGSVLDGDEVHDLVARRTVLVHDAALTPEFGAGRRYRLDHYARRLHG